MRADLIFWMRATMRHCYYTIGMVQPRGFIWVLFQKYWPGVSYEEFEFCWEFMETSKYINGKKVINLYAFLND